ncbi:hypothetical protein AAF712_001857 [Marasmius tenuissimus]|uniref:Uncharacterized protein n=1 Tax=Marasmius tenuissimus TaxID=585030 RepID=A0ABR3ABK8_9AGAR|nr:hypothetical protein PM082_007988 [Marasmius tenuissimus]
MHSSSRLFAAALFLIAVVGTGYNDASALPTPEPAKTPKHPKHDTPKLDTSAYKAYSGSVGNAKGGKVRRGGILDIASLNGGLAGSSSLLKLPTDKPDCEDGVKYPETVGEREYHGAGLLDVDTLGLDHKRLGLRGLGIN